MDGGAAAAAGSAPEAMETDDDDAAAGGGGEEAAAEGARAEVGAVAGIAPMRLRVRFSLGLPDGTAPPEGAPVEAFGEGTTLLHCLQRLRETSPLRAQLTPRELGYHPGVTCDRTGMSPILGDRYKLDGENYDGRELRRVRGRVPQDGRSRARNLHSHRAALLPQAARQRPARLAPLVQGGSPPHRRRQLLARTLRFAPAARRLGRRLGRLRRRRRRLAAAAVERLRR
mmetsp:Transcript_1536/g.5198  ORF Transcript_1536/g.5198 Transcript_1536/m.5198 type:complete len:228 (-) Transcript_1536:55-738(-)